jgi:hypothetical protein
MLIAERTQKVILVYVRFFMDGNIKYVGIYYPLVSNFVVYLNCVCLGENPIEVVLSNCITYYKR